MTRYNKGDRVREDTPTYPIGTVVWSTDEYVSVHWDGDSYAQEISATSGRILLARACAVELDVGDKVHKRDGHDGVVLMAGATRSTVRFDHNKFVAEVENVRLVLLEKAPKPKAPSWNDVEKGDLVEFKFKGETHSTTAYREGSHTMVMGYGIGSYWVRANFIPISITKPVKPLPTKPGTVIRVIGMDGLVHRREAYQKDFPWISDSGVTLTEKTIINCGWEEAS